MVQRINIEGVIIPNDYKWYYDLFEESSTCPADVKAVLNIVQPDDQIRVYVNSPGGAVDAGSEIYTLLREAASSFDVKIYVTGEACSAASVIAMSAYCEMAPTALMMVHCVASSETGNHNDMEKMAETLQIADEALCTAYMDKSGMSKEDALAMMEAETWLTAEQAKEKGLIDAIMFEDDEPDQQMVAGLFQLPSDEQLSRARALMDEEKKQAQRKKDAATLRLRSLQLVNPATN